MDINNIKKIANGSILERLGPAQKAGGVRKPLLVDKTCVHLQEAGNTLKPTVHVSAKRTPSAGTLPTVE